MKKAKQYSTPTAFRRALEDRLTQIAENEGTDIQRLRRQVAFDRLLARLFSETPAPWILKGGYAMQLRTPSARATKDVDLAIRDTKFFSSKKTQQNAAILEMLREKVELDLGDFLVFLISEPILDLEAAPYGGARFHVEAHMDDRIFEKFHLDVGVGDVWIEPVEKLKSRDWLGFAGIHPKEFPVISKEQQFAEKLHAYTLPRGEGITNSRVKDLVDMVLLISSSEMKSTATVHAIKATFDQRSTHKLPAEIQTPPKTWGATFTVMANGCGISPDINSAYQTVYGFIKKLPIK